MKAKIRKLVTFVEETCSEMGKTVNPPTRRAAAVAVIENPSAGKYVEDLTELVEIGEELGTLLTERAVAALGIGSVPGKGGHHSPTDLSDAPVLKVNEIHIALCVHGDAAWIDLSLIHI